jgi:hypothetical protein
MDIDTTYGPVVALAIPSESEYQRQVAELVRFNYFVGATSIHLYDGEITFCAVMVHKQAAQPALAPDRVTAPDAASLETLAGAPSATPPHAAGEA